MKKLKVEVCVCTECVMKGAMDLMESIEGMKELRKLGGDLPKTNFSVQVTTNKCLGESHHGAKSPLVMVDGAIMEKATSAAVMERIMGIVQDKEN